MFMSGRGESEHEGLANIHGEDGRTARKDVLRRSDGEQSRCAVIVVELIEMIDLILDDWFKGDVAVLRLLDRSNILATQALS